MLERCEAPEYRRMKGAVEMILNSTGPKTVPAFSFDERAFSGAKPWTSEEFQSDPEEFQFAIIGDRTGGADAKGVFIRAIHPLNLLQPEFVINEGRRLQSLIRKLHFLRLQEDGKQVRPLSSN
jgi:hypothetical protein